MKNNFIAISIFSLAVSIVIGSWLVSNGLDANVYTESNETAQKKNDVNNEMNKKLLTQEELASYLGLSIEDSKKLGPVGESGNTTSELPYIKIDENVYYSKDAIDKWLLEDGLIHINY